MIEFIVPCVPIAQPRQRTRVVHSGGRAFASNYTPTRDPVNVFKATVRLSFQATEGRMTLLGPVSIELVFVFPRPRNKVWKSKPMPRLLHSKKPDFDNLAKAICDSLNGLAWVDDSQICDARVSKRIASGEEQPHVFVRIGECNE